MTVKQDMIFRLMHRGLPAIDAQIVVNNVRKADEKKWGSRWDDQSTQFHGQLLHLLWMDVRQAALECIDANDPGVWYRGVILAN
jgi:hypothetical protein